MTTRWQEWLQAQDAERRAAGLHRELRPRTSDAARIDLAGNDYLGLSTHPDVRAAAAQAAQEWGGGAGASRLVSGTLALHAELEEALADLTGRPSGLVMSTGYHANLGVVAGLVGRGDLIVSDAHVHASLIDGARLSRADVVVTGHQDVDAVRDALAKAGDRRAIVLVESVYSVLGDAAPLRELAEVARDAGALLVVDEAHGLGVVGDGRGLCHHLGLTGPDWDPHVIVTATLSKALGAQGGAVLATPAVRTHLVNRARPFIFDTGLAPAAAAAALAAVRLIRADPDRPAVIAARVADLCDTLGLPRPAGAVVSVPMASPTAATDAQAALRAEGIDVGCFRPPSVPDGVSRLRITVNAGLTDDVWERAAARVAAVVGVAR